jgi:hypothetical protein
MDETSAAAMKATLMQTMKWQYRSKPVKVVNMTTDRTVALQLESLYTLMPKPI